MTVPRCQCLDDSHDHSEDGCAGEGFSQSVEHGNQWYCQRCYLDFIKRRDNAKIIMAALVSIPQNKQKDAIKQLTQILGGAS